MRQPTSRSIAMAAAVSIVAIGLAACSSSSDGDSGSVKTLTLWASQSTPEAVSKVVEDYEKSSGVAIDVVTVPDSFEENVATKWAAGQRPDLIFYQPGPGALSQLNPKKNLVDLGDLPFMDKTKYGLADSGVVDGVHYTATYSFPAVFGIYYNKKVFAANGVSVPTTVADLDQVAATLKAKGVTPFDVTGGDSWTTQIPYLESLTDQVKDGMVQKLDDGDEQYTNQSIVDAAAVQKDWVAKKWTNPDYATALYADVPAQLQAGKVAMYVMPSWMNASFTDPTDIGFFPYPSDSGAVQWQSSNNASVQVPKTGDDAKQAAAEDFVNYLTVGDGYKALNAALKEPSIIDGVSDSATLSPLQKAAADAFANGGVASFDQQVRYSPNTRPDLLAQVLTGQLTPEEFGSELQTQTDALKKLQGQ